MVQIKTIDLLLAIALPVYFQGASGVNASSHRLRSCFVFLKVLALDSICCRASRRPFRHLHFIFPCFIIITCKKKNCKRLVFYLKKQGQPQSGSREVWLYTKHNGFHQILLSTDFGIFREHTDYNNPVKRFHC